jgi:hypothetical protein
VVAVGDLTGIYEVVYGGETYAEGMWPKNRFRAWEASVAEMVLYPVYCLQVRGGTLRWMGFEEDATSVIEEQAESGTRTQLEEEDLFYFRAEMLFGVGVEVLTDFLRVGGAEDRAGEGRVVG